MQCRKNYLHRAAAFESTPKYSFVATRLAYLRESLSNPNLSEAAALRSGRHAAFRDSADAGT